MADAFKCDRCKELFDTSHRAIRRQTITNIEKFYLYLSIEYMDSVYGETKNADLCIPCSHILIQEWANSLEIDLCHRCNGRLVGMNWVEAIIDDEPQKICPPCMETYMANTGQD